MNNDDIVRLRHTADAAREAIEFAAGRTRTDLDNDRMLVRALTKDIEIVGEARRESHLGSKAGHPIDPLAVNRHHAQPADPWLLRH